jgi:pimeloyl-ACP methyl ester carboxylesterase
MADSSIVSTQDGIRWYVERQGSGPNLILIPSGEGDCASLATVARHLAPSFTVTTFDMPGMSRTTAPPAATKDVTAPLLASQIISLMDKLSIDTASFWGCSSGGSTALALAANHPERVRSIVIHEVPLALFDNLIAMTTLPDEAIAAACKEAFLHGFVEDPVAWNALGPDYHRRLEKNYVVWVHEYVRTVPLLKLSEGDLRKRPITWTIGSLSPEELFADNIVTAAKAGIDVGRLQCMRFPQVTIPVALAEHIRNAALKNV